MNKAKETSAWYFKELQEEQSNAKVYRTKRMVRERINTRPKKLQGKRLTEMWIFFLKNEHWATVS